MAVTMLHLVDDEGNPVSAEIRIAVELAFRICLQRYPRMDAALLASMAENVASSMSRRSAEIQALKQYAQFAMLGRVQDWVRKHPGIEILVENTQELERLSGAPQQSLFSDAEAEILFAQMKSQLGERDRHILVLMEQDLAKPGEIAAALNISYGAAAKALERVKDRVSNLLRSYQKAEKSARDDNGTGTGLRPRRFRVNLR
jgi:DNA-directed RNA polymerase specialized sigma24 family protein